MPIRPLMPALAFAGVVGCISSVAADDRAGTPEFFETKVRPVLVEHCYKCHADQKGKEPKGGLRVDGRAALLAGGDSGPSLVPGSPEKSRLIEAVRYTNADLQMPPRGKLPEAAIADLTAWVKAGAVWPNDSGAAGPAGSGFDLHARKREHWAWQPVRPVDPPAVRDGGWASGPADRFILSRLEEKGLRPAPPAEPRDWIRRVTFDLTGLPPTPAEVEQFLADPSPAARRTVVDRLLTSPQFGERWARHWLDLVRYAETRGHEFDAGIPNAYQYRDYVIRAFNADVPYDQFVREHVAGDLLPEPRRDPARGFNESILGTGFWFLGEEVHSPVDIRQDQADRFDNRLDVLTKAFLGLTVSCARCHDHKFDAISTKDYYALYGFLTSTGYRLARFETMDANLQVARRLDELNRQQAVALARALAVAAGPYTQQVPDYLLAAREAIRSGPEYRPADAAEVVFEDFERGTYDGWQVAGTAFGDRPQTLDSIAPYQGKINATGKYFVNSHNIRGGGDTARGDAHTGTLTSREFVITHRHVTLLVGGGAHAGKTCVNLLVGGKVARTATGRNDNQMFPVRWDVADLKGQKARIQIVDDATGGWGNIGVDDIRFIDRGDPSPRDIRAADFSEAFRQRMDRIARARNLDAPRLAGWVELILRAAADPADPFHLWARVSGEAKAEEPARLAEILAALRPAPVAVDEADIIIDYARSTPADWFPDEGSFGVGPVRPGYLVVSDSRQVRFADHAAAEYDRAWDRLTPLPGSDLDHGSLGKRPRAGRTLRTPNFQITSGKVHYLIRGGGMVYAAVDGHSLVAGPLHGQLVRDVPAAPGFRWVTHDLTPYRGHHAHLEFTPAPDADLAIAMVVQGDRPPVVPGMALVPEGEIATLADLAEAYSRQLTGTIGRLKDGPPGTMADARMANALLARVPIDKTADVKAAADAFTAGRARLAAEIQPASRLALAAWDGNGIDEHVFIRGSPRGIGERVPRRFLEGLTGTGPITTPVGSGRLELARQMTDPAANPFIARVMVNRVWHHLFGRGIVGSVDNFGLLGEAPTHPELLDFLAERFVREGWSVKGLVRDLVLSSAYGMSTQGDPQAAAADPQNLLTHRARLRRLEGEAIRDAMLAVSGRLDRTGYGPPVPVHLTPFLDGRGRPSASGPLDGAGRRSVYLAVRRNFLNPMLLAFDTPIPFSTVGRRQVSNVPAQALILMNDPFVHQQAEHWAKGVLGEPGSPAERVNRMYLAAFGRPPTADETAACLEFITEQAGRHQTGVEDVKPWTDLAHTLFNTKEFLYLN